MGRFVILGALVGFGAAVLTLRPRDAAPQGPTVATTPAERRANALSGPPLEIVGLAGPRIRAMGLIPAAVPDAG